MDRVTENIASAVVDAALDVHRALGPGLLESVYQACLAHELRTRGHRVECELPCPVLYRGLKVPSGYRIDMLVDNRVIVENKAVSELQTVHVAQVLTYLKLSQRNIGLLINWNVPLIKDGIRRLIRKC